MQPSEQPDLEEQDPTLHMLSSARYQRLPDGRPTKSPVTLTERATVLRESLARARQDEATIDNDWRDGVVAFSRERGLIMAVLLRELSARVRPGTVVGPMRCDDAMADLAAELATDLHAARTATEYGD
jgi:hypothetical protein